MIKPKSNYLMRLGEREIKSIETIHNHLEQKLGLSFSVRSIISLSLFNYENQINWRINNHE